jgi:hypothetical protein
MDILYTIVCVYVGEESVYVHDTALSFRRLIRRWVCCASLGCGAGALVSQSQRPNQVCVDSTPTARI